MYNLEKFFCVLNISILHMKSRLLAVETIKTKVLKPQLVWCKLISKLHLYSFPEKTASVLGPKGYDHNFFFKTSIYVSQENIKNPHIVYCIKWSARVEI